MTKIMFVFLVPSILEGTYVISVVFLSGFCLSVRFLSFCHSVRNADISETIIARAAKFGMHNLHIKSAKFVEGIFKRCLRSRDIAI